MTAIKMCPAADAGAHCDELEGHKPVLVNGLSWEHFDHHAGRGWNNEPPRSFEVELTDALPAHTWYHTNGFDWNAIFTTAAGEWLVARLDKGERGHLVAISGPKVEFKAFDASPELVIAVLRLRGALDDPAITGVSWEARRFLADQGDTYITECTKRLADNGGATTHERAHLNGMTAMTAWLRGELGLPKLIEPVEPVVSPEMVLMGELVRDAWWLISRAHGGQPWDAHGTWRDNATDWRDRYRKENPSADLIEEARALILSVVGNQGSDWEDNALVWRERHAAWFGARS